MKDFKSLSILQIKRNGLWIGLLVIAVLLINSIYFKTDLDNDYKNIVESVAFFESNKIFKDVEKKEKPEKISKEYLEYADSLRDRLVKEYNILTNEEIAKLDGDEINEYYNSLNNYDYELDAEISNYDYFRRNKLDKDNRFSIKEKYANGMIVFFVFLLASLFTSIEHMTNYFDFTRMMPWSKNKDFLMKVILAILITSLVLLANTIFQTLMVKSSAFSPLVITNDLFANLFRELILYLSLAILFVSLGAISGNIFGHIGLFIVSIGFTEIIFYILPLIQRIFFNLSVDDKNLRGYFYEFLEKSNPYLKAFLAPVQNFGFENYMLVAYLAIGLIIFALANIVVKNMKVERAGTMVINKPIKIICLILSTFLLTTFVMDILFYSLHASRYLVMALYIFFLFASYKLFKTLLNVKIKV